MVFTVECRACAMSLMDSWCLCLRICPVGLLRFPREGPSNLLAEGTILAARVWGSREEQRCLEGSVDHLGTLQSPLGFPVFRASLVPHHEMSFLYCVNLKNKIVILPAKKKKMGLFKNNKGLQFGISKLWQNHRQVQNKQTREEYYFMEKKGEVGRSCFEQKAVGERARVQGDHSSFLIVQVAGIVGFLWEILCPSCKGSLLSRILLILL